MGHTISPQGKESEVPETIKAKTRKYVKSN
jgi:hypothetical protein